MLDYVVSFYSTYNFEVSLFPSFYAILLPHYFCAFFFIEESSCHIL